MEKRRMLIASGGASRFLNKRFVFGQDEPICATIHQRRAHPLYKALDHMTNALFCDKNHTRRAAKLTTMKKGRSSRN